MLNAENRPKNGAEQPLSVDHLTDAIPPTEASPINPATSMCLRGPCKHLWMFTSHMEVLGPRISPERTRTCNAGIEEHDPTTQPVSDCNYWWPAPLEFIPLSLRPILRPYLTRFWEWSLRRRGYHFGWRHWADHNFEDHPEPPVTE